MRFLSALSILVLSSMVVADGGYSSSCKDPIFNESTLDIECRGVDDDGDEFYERTLLDLNDCYATIDNGSIVPRKKYVASI